MPVVRVSCIAVVALCCAVLRADASCPVTLEGDPMAVEPIRVELGSFTDDGSPCVALWVACRKASEQLEIELHDELGRSSQRRFASAGGAAAFIISWSRRPLLPNLVATEQAPSGIASPPHTAPQDRSWRPELELAYLRASGGGRSSDWAVMTVSLRKRAGIWRYGGTLRGMFGGHEGLELRGYVNTEVEGTFGVAHELSNRFTVHADLLAGTSLITFSNSPDRLDYGGRDSRTGARTALGWHVHRSVLLEISIGYEYAWQYVDHADGAYEDFVGFLYGGGGVRWTL